MNENFLTIQNNAYKYLLFKFQQNKNITMGSQNLKFDHMRKYFLTKPRSRIAA